MVKKFKFTNEEAFNDLICMIQNTGTASLDTFIEQKFNELKENDGDAPLTPAVKMTAHDLYMFALFVDAMEKHYDVAQYYPCDFIDLYQMVTVATKVVCKEVGIRHSPHDIFIVNLLNEDLLGRCERLSTKKFAKETCLLTVRILNEFRK